MKDKIDILIFQQLDGNLSEEDRALLNKWISETKENAEYFKKVSGLHNNISNINFTLDPQTDAEWAKLDRVIHIASKQTPKGRVVRLRALLKVAASIAVIVAIGWFISNSLWNNPESYDKQFAALPGTSERVELQDGSLVTLSGGSTLEVSNDFNKKSRNLKLLGQGFFEVKPDLDKPFGVYTGNVYTEVLGTSFLLTAFPDDPNVRLSVAEGRVRFQSEDQDGLVLKTGDAAYFDDAQAKFEKESYDAAQTHALKTGKFVFANQRLPDVFREIEHYYNIEITDRSGLEHRTLNSVFNRTDSFELILNTIAFTFGLEVEIQDNRVVIAATEE